jgi:hypothetical protein
LGEKISPNFLYGKKFGKKKRREKKGTCYPLMKKGRTP